MASEIRVNQIQNRSGLTTTTFTNSGVDVVGIFFFDDNTMLLQKGNPKGERLAKIAAEKGMLLMMCDQCANQRGLASENSDGGYSPEGTVDGVAVGCFPDLYSALSGNMPDQVISL